MHELLDEDGVVLVNIVSSLEGKRSQFLRAEYHTYRSVFPQVYLFPVNGAANPTQIQNLILVALKSTTPPSFTSDNPEWQAYLNTRWIKEIPQDLPLLTDDHAPVDQYIMRALL